MLSVILIAGIPVAAALLFAYLWYVNREFFVVKLIRHGQSTQNTGEEDTREVGDHNIRLTGLGWDQGRNRGRAIGRKGFDRALIYFSPYRRARETRQAILEGAGFTPAQIEAIPRYEDPLLREVEFGYDDVGSQEDLRDVHGYFYYRFDGGESPADAYDRLAGFIEALWHQVRRKLKFNYLKSLLGLQPGTVYIIGHGLTNRLFVMRWLHLTVEQFDTIANPHNCDEITIAPVKWLENPQFVCGRWGVEGLRMRADEDSRQQ